MVTALRYGVDDHGTRNTMPPLTRDFTGSDAPGKVIIASRWRAFSIGLFFTVYMLIFESNAKGMFLILSFEYKLFSQSKAVVICQKKQCYFFMKK